MSPAVRAALADFGRKAHRAAALAALLLFDAVNRHESSPRNDILRADQPRCNDRRGRATVRHRFCPLFTLQTAVGDQQVGCTQRVVSDFMLPPSVRSQDHQPGAMLDPGRLPRHLLFPAPFTNRLDFFRRDVQEFQELLVLFRRRAFELRVPAAHIVFAESGAAHYFYPLFFRNHRHSLQAARLLEQPRDGPLMFAQRFDFRAQFLQTALENGGRGAARLAQIWNGCRSASIPPGCTPECAAAARVPFRRRRGSCRRSAGPASAGRWIRSREPRCGLIRRRGPAG